MKDEMRVTIIATGFSEAPDSAPIIAPRERVRGRVNLFAQNEPLTLDDDHRSRAKDPDEPDPVPAIHRKREREGTPPPQPVINFDRDDNPLREWDAPPTPPAFGRTEAAEERRPASPSSASPAQPTPAPHGPIGNPSPTGAVFADSDVPPAAGGEATGEEDPYDIPALQRRRRQRFFD